MYTPSYLSYLSASSTMNAHNYQSIVSPPQYNEETLYCKPIQRKLSLERDLDCHVPSDKYLDRYRETYASNQCQQRYRTLSGDNFVACSANMQYKPKCPTFSGEENWETFIKQFEVVAGIYSWSDIECRQYLLIALSESAADFAFEKLSQSPDLSYSSLVIELGRYFRRYETKEMSQRLFHSRRLEKDEQIHEFADALKQLLHRAYPNLPHEAQKDLLIQQFFDGFDDRDMVYSVRYLQKPRALDEAVDLVKEHMSFTSCERQLCMVKPSHTEDEQNYCPSVFDRSRLTYHSRLGGKQF